MGDCWLGIIENLINYVTESRWRALGDLAERSEMMAVMVCRTGGSMGMGWIRARGLHLTLA